MFDKDVIEAIKSHARAVFPEESCGIVADGKYLSFENEADDPLNSFKLNAKRYARHQIEGKVQAVVHSHPNGPDYPSLADMKSQFSTAIPWGICYLTPTRLEDPFWWGEGVPIAPYQGRPFRMGVHDCYSLVRDWYRKEKGIVLLDGPRAPDWWEDEKKHGNPIVENLTKAGFKEITREEMREGDCFLMQLQAYAMCHTGVYLGRGLILHHMARRLSVQESMSAWTPYVRKWLRYSP